MIALQKEEIAEKVIQLKSIDTPTIDDKQQEGGGIPEFPLEGVLIGILTAVYLKISQKIKTSSFYLN